MNTLRLITIILGVTLREKIDQEVKKDEHEAEFTWGL